MAKDFFSNSDNPKSKAKKKKKISPNIDSLKHKKKRKRNPPLRSSSPKEKELLTDEERHKRRVLAAIKAARTRKENEAKLSPEEREKLRQKRRDQFLKNTEKARQTKKEKEALLTPEEKQALKNKRSEAARKAAETREENEAKLSPEEREKLRQKRREQFLKNMEKARQTKKEKEASLIPEEKEELKKKRSEAAKKAAETRRENEEKLSPEEREQLRQKRANILRDNLERKKFKEGFEKGIYLTGDVTPEEIDEIKEQLAWEKYDTLIGEINQGYNAQTAQALIDIINRGVENQGINDYMDKVSSDLISEDIRVIVFADSLSAQVVASIQRLVSILDYTASDYGDTLALASEIGEILAGEIYSRRYQEFNLP